MLRLIILLVIFIRMKVVGKYNHKLNKKLPDAGFDYHYNGLNNGRKLMYNYEIFIEYSPVGLILNISIMHYNLFLLLM